MVNSFSDPASPEIKQSHRETWKFCSGAEVPALAGARFVHHGHQDWISEGAAAVQEVRLFLEHKDVHVRLLDAETGGAGRMVCLWEPDVSALLAAEGTPNMLAYVMPPTWLSLKYANMRLHQLRKTQGTL